MKKTLLVLFVALTVVAMAATPVFAGNRKPPATITCISYYDMNGNGRYDGPQDPLIGGCPWYVTDPISGSQQFGYTSSGELSFVVLPKWTYHVSAPAPSGWQSVTQNEWTVEVNKNGTTLYSGYVLIN